SNSAIRGISFWYTNQNKDNNPIVYPFTIGADPSIINPFPGNTLASIVIENIELMAAYNGIDLTACSRHFVRNIVGQVFNIGVKFDYILDVGRVENVHLPLYWSGFRQSIANGGVATTPVIAAYQWGSGTAFLIQRTDAQEVFNCFALGYNRGVWLKSGTQGDPNCQFQGLSFDTCRTCIQIDAGDRDTGLQFTNTFLAAETVFVQTLTTGAAILVSSSFTSHVRFTNGVIWGLSPSVVSNGGNVVFTNMTFNDSNTSIYSVKATGGTIAFNQCQFLKASHHVQLTSGV